MKNNEPTQPSSQSIAAPLHMGGFDLVWKDGPIPVPTGGASPSSLGQKSTYGTMLGADFDKRLNTFVTSSVNSSPLNSINDTLAEKLARKAETIREASQLAATFATKQSSSSSSSLPASVASSTTAGVSSGTGSSSVSIQSNGLGNRPGLSAMISAFKNNGIRDRPSSRGSTTGVRGRNDEQNDSTSILSTVSGVTSNVGVVVGGGGGGERLRPWTVGAGAKRSSTKTLTVEH